MTRPVHPQAVAPTVLVVSLLMVLLGLIGTPLHAAPVHTSDVAAAHVVIGHGNVAARQGNIAPLRAVEPPTPQSLIPVGLAFSCALLLFLGVVLQLVWRAPRTATVGRSRGRSPPMSLA
ncbi:MAG: hypothetical protein ACRDRN_10210 [Sciscionella sp.]